MCQWLDILIKLLKILIHFYHNLAGKLILIHDFSFHEQYSTVQYSTLQYSTVQFNSEGFFLFCYFTPHLGLLTLWDYDKWFKAYLPVWLIYSGGGSDGTRRGVPGRVQHGGPAPLQEWTNWRVSNGESYFRVNAPLQFPGCFSLRWTQVQTYYWSADQNASKNFWLRKEPKKCRCCLSVGGSVCIML